jgi:Uma2 family endonuclease
LFLSNARSEHATDAFAQGADLVIEVVSPDDPRRDLEIKRREYAQAGIPEYWIVDPTTALITVLTLAGDRYAVHGEFAAGAQATSLLLPDFAVAVGEVFAAAG